MTDHSNIPALMAEMGARAKAAAAELAFAPAEQKARALAAAADAVWARRAEIIAANEKDMAFGRDKGLSAAMLDRLMLDEARIEGIVKGLRSVAGQGDPVGAVIAEWDMPSGLHIQRVRTPLGVIGVIYESRPNVTADAGALCLKSGNAVILRGGSEGLNSATAIHACLVQGIKAAGLPEAAIQLVPTRDRAAVQQLLTMTDHVDVIVPRGGKGLIERVAAESKVPVLAHLDGICHVYIDVDADRDKAHRIAFNAKTQRYGTCNTMETLLVARARADMLPELVAALQSEGVEVRGCEASRQAAPDIAVDAVEADWSTEYLAPILSIKLVEDVDEAMSHIARYGSNHTESIVTENASTAERFLREVDSGSVMHNASTRFADGFEYGLGAEIGISTGKLHARGPVGLEGLTSRKYIVKGDGHIRQ